MLKLPLTEIPALRKTLINETVSKIYIFKTYGNKSLKNTVFRVCGLGFSCCLYSTNISVTAVQPIKIYKNADKDKPQIFKENKEKAGVYRWVNLINGKTYVGSSVNLGRRFRVYLNLRYFIKRNRILYKAFFKYGYSNFRLEILEYCDQEKTVSREQYYLDLLNPDYNILKIAGSTLGFKHSENTKAKIKAKMKTRIWTEEHKAKRLEHLKRLHSSEEYKAKRLEILNIRNASKEHLEQLKRLKLHNSKEVVVFDTLNNNNTTTVYPSIAEAAKSMGCTSSAIVKALKDQEKGNNRLVKKRYMVFPYTDKSKIADTFAGLKQKGESYAHSVLVEDILNGNETVYGSIRDAAVAIGCVHATILNAIKHQKETGVTRVIKKRFKVKHI